jgi:hypothetical protein
MGHFRGTPPVCQAFNLVPDGAQPARTPVVSCSLPDREDARERPRPRPQTEPGPPRFAGEGRYRGLGERAPVHAHAREVTPGNVGGGGPRDRDDRSTPPFDEDRDLPPEGGVEPRSLAAMPTVLLRLARAESPPTAGEGRRSGVGARARLPTRTRSEQQATNLAESREYRHTMLISQLRTMNALDAAPVLHDFPNKPHSPGATSIL